jgi:hypothetical protein
MGERRPPSSVTRPGPAQPDDIGWSTLGLVATSDAARRAGHQRPLLELQHWVVKSKPAEVNATEDLMHEHGVIRRTLLVYEA